MPRSARLLLWGALLFGSLPRADAVARTFPADRDQRSDVRRYYMSMATSALEGRGFLPSYPTNFIPPPGQAFFLYTLKRLWPESDYQHLRSVQVVVSLATILAAFAAGALLHGHAAGVVCAWLVALNYRLSHLVGILLAETNHVFLLFAFLVVLLWARRRGPLAAFFGAGVLLGLACLFKPAPTLLAPLLALVLAAPGRFRGPALRQGLALLGGFVATVAPWTLRNLVHYGHLYPISTNGGTLLALANAPELDSASPQMRYWDDLYQLPYYRDPAIEARYAGLLDVDGKPEENLKDRAYFGKAVGYVLRRPLHFARNYAYKVRNFLWYPTDQPVVAGPFPFRELPGFTRLVVWTGLLSLAGWLWRDRRDPDVLVLATVTFYLLAFGALYHLTRDGRMSLPFEALTAVPAALGLTRAARFAHGALRGRR